MSVTPFEIEGPRELDYAGACQAAADHQGITAIEKALQDVGLRVVVEQTGGFTMVATVYAGRNVYALNDDDGINVGHFTWEAWQETGDVAISERTFSTVSDAAAHVRSLVSHHQAPTPAEVPCEQCGRATQPTDGPEWTTCPSLKSMCVACCPCHASPVDDEDGQRCALCGDVVHTLSSRQWCDGCEAEKESQKTSDAMQVGAM